jgi:plasmid stabilization system protein ParE
VADRYLAAIEVGLRACAFAPEHGRPREEVLPGHWSRLIRLHVAFCTFTDDEVVLRRVLHASMDPDEHLDDDS